MTFSDENISISFWKYIVLPSMIIKYRMKDLCISIARRYSNLSSSGWKMDCDGHERTFEFKIWETFADHLFSTLGVISTFDSRDTVRHVLGVLPLCSTQSRQHEKTGQYAGATSIDISLVPRSKSRCLLQLLPHTDLEEAEQMFSGFMKTTIHNDDSSSAISLSQVPRLLNVFGSPISSTNPTEYMKRGKTICNRLLQATSTSTRTWTSSLPLRCCGRFFVEFSLLSKGALALEYDLANYCFMHTARWEHLTAELAANKTRVESNESRWCWFAWLWGTASVPEIPPLSLPPPTILPPVAMYGLLSRLVELARVYSYLDERGKLSKVHVVFYC